MQPDTPALFTSMQLAAFVGIAAFLLSMYVNVLKARKLNKPDPDNAELSKAVTRLTAIVENHDAALAKLEAGCAAHKLHGSSEIGKVHNRVDEVAAGVAKLDGKMDMLLHRLTTARKV